MDPPWPGSHSRAILDDGALAIQEAQRGILLHALDLLFELLRSPQVIVVQEGDELAARHLQRSGAGSRRARILLGQVPNARVTSPVGLDDLPRVVGGAVVQDDTLPVGICLGLDRSEERR